MTVLTIAAGILLAVAVLAFLAGLGFVGCALAAILTAEKPKHPPTESTSDSKERQGASSEAGTMPKLKVNKNSALHMRHDGKSFSILGRTDLRTMVFTPEKPFPPMEEE